MHTHSTLTRPYLLVISALAVLFTAPSLTAQTAAPPFTVVSLDDSTKLISTESLRGKVVLIDFWATWCPPCVEEIPELTRVYGLYKDRGFEILSLSFDKTAGHVRRFRSKHFAMPWLHAIVERGFGDYISELFHVLNIPRQILIDPDGRIVAEDEALRGAQLEGTVSRFVDALQTH